MCASKLGPRGESVRPNRLCQRAIARIRKEMSTSGSPAPKETAQAATRGARSTRSSKERGAGDRVAAAAPCGTQGQAEMFGAAPSSVRAPCWQYHRVARDAAAVCPLCAGRVHVIVHACMHRCARARVVTTSQSRLDSKQANDAAKTSGGGDGGGPGAARATRGRPLIMMLVRPAFAVARPTRVRGRSPCAMTGKSHDRRWPRSSAPL